MANATAKVSKGVVHWSDEFITRSTETLAAETTFYAGAMVGIDETGYYCKFDDSQAAIFAGVVRGREGNTVLAAGTAGDAALNLEIHQPKRLEIAISGVAVTDIGKKVYASDDKTGILTNGGTYSNFIGHVVDVVASGIALVEPVYDGVAANARFGVARTMAATGAQTITKYDLNKTIIVPNTAALTLTLPAVADTQAGDRLTFVKSTSDAFAITLDGNASETIDGATTYAALDAQFDCVTIVSTGSAWVILNRDVA